MDIWDEFNMLVNWLKTPDEMNEQEEDPGRVYISRTESHINVKTNWIYEFVMLSFPMQKMCSEEEMGGPQCNKSSTGKLNVMKHEQQEEHNANPV